jgi:hypothetical protein
MQDNVDDLLGRRTNKLMSFGGSGLCGHWVLGSEEQGRRIFAVGRAWETVKGLVTLDGALGGTDGGTINGR